VRKPGIGITAWFLEFGPTVEPVPPTIAGPDSGIFEASIAWLGPSAFRTGTQSASGKAVKKAVAKRTARFMANLRRLPIQQAEDRPRCAAFMRRSAILSIPFFKGSLVASWSQPAERQRR
jgi:hypothetical protein